MGLQTDYSGEGPSRPALQPPTPPQPPKLFVHSFLEHPTPDHARNAERPLSEFIRAQQAKLADRRRRAGPRRRRSPNQARRCLWLADDHYPAWTMCGELVVIRDPDPRTGRGSPLVRRPTAAERHHLFAADRLIDVVIALYRGDSLDRKPVGRYLTHRDLESALATALARAIEVEKATPPPAEPVVEAGPNTAPEPPPSRAKGSKTRFHPLGNFIAYVPAGHPELPDFVIQPVPGAFTTRRAAKRFLGKLRRRGDLPADVRIARVLARVKARPRFRPGIRLPKDEWQRTLLIRKAPRVVLPELDLEWLPRYERVAGEWVPEQFKVRRTVRHGVRARLYEQLRETSAAVIRTLDEAAIRKSLGDLDAAEDSLAELNEHLPLVLHCSRILPAHVRAELDLDHIPYWPDIAKRAGPGLLQDEGHWVRAPFEYKAPGVVRPCLHLVELRIDDLATLLEWFGPELEFWMVKEETSAAPRWVLAGSTS